MKTIDEILRIFDEIREKTTTKSWSLTFRKMAEYAHSLQTPEPEWLPIPEDRNVPLPALIPDDPYTDLKVTFWRSHVPNNATHYCPITVPKPLPKPLPKPDPFEQWWDDILFTRNPDVKNATKMAWAAALEYAKENEQ